jgi:hypothetical protein
MEEAVWKVKMARRLIEFIIDPDILEGDPVTRKGMLNERLEDLRSWKLSEETPEMKAYVTAARVLVQKMWSVHLLSNGITKLEEEVETLMQVSPGDDLGEIDGESALQVLGKRAMESHYRK